MNSKMYLDGLESLDEDMEPGLLSEIRMDTPDIFHKSVMSEIRNQKKKRFYMNYRIYMPVAAAVLVAAIFVNGGKNFVNQLHVDKPVENAVLTPQPTKNITPPIAINGPTDSTKGDNETKKDTTIAAITPGAAAKGSTTAKNKTDSAVKKPSASVQDKSTTANTTDGKSIAMNTDINGKDIVASNGSDTTVQSSETDSNINLEITANNQSGVISFLKSYGILTEDGKNKIYKLSTSYLSQLQSVMDTDAIEGKLINGQCSGDDLTIRLVVNE